MIYSFDSPVTHAESSITWLELIAPNGMVALRSGAFLRPGPEALDSSVRA